MSLTVRVLIGLVAGLAAGLFLSAWGTPGAFRLAGILEPAGTVWVNALRMTVIPLVVGSLVAGIAGERDSAVVGRLGRRALLIFVLMLSVTATLTVLVAPILFSGLSVDAGTAAALRVEGGTSAGDAAAKLPTVGQWITDLVPANPVRAASEGAMLPLIVFTLIFGLAASRLGEPARSAIVAGSRALAETMLVIVRWVLAVAPIGVFALSVGLAARLGLAAAGAVAYYVFVVSGLCLVLIVALYPITAAIARMRIGQFARGTIPAQAVAFSSRSSLASLPAMIEGARDKLRLREEIQGFFLPLAASVFRVGGAVGIPTGAIFIARLYGVPLGPGQLAAVVIVSIVMTFSVPGIPGGSIVVMAPVLIAAGVPAAGIGILLGLDTIPDMFRTTANVTGHMSAAAILDAAPRRE